MQVLLKIFLSIFYIYAKKVFVIDFMVLFVFLNVGYKAILAYVKSLF